MLVNNKQLSILTVGDTGLRLMPGVNSLPSVWNEEKWNDVVDKYPKVKHLLDEDLLEVDFGSGDDEGEPDEQPEQPQPASRRAQKVSTSAANHLQSLSEKEATRLVKQTADETLLQAWHERETRDSVVTAIETQFAHLAQAGEKKGQG